jgi:hypothetical protein
MYGTYCDIQRRGSSLHARTSSLTSLSRFLMSLCERSQVGIINRGQRFFRLFFPVLIPRLSLRFQTGRDPGYLALIVSDGPSWLTVEELDNLSPPVGEDDLLVGAGELGWRRQFDHARLSRRVVSISARFRGLVPAVTGFVGRIRGLGALRRARGGAGGLELRGK